MLPIERVQATRRYELSFPTLVTRFKTQTPHNGNRKNTLAELKAKFEHRHEKAPRQALLEEIRARFEQDICPPHQVFEDCKWEPFWTGRKRGMLTLHAGVMVHHRWDCG